MVAVTWLFLGYLLHTTGELCLSPVGLSIVTKLSPARLVSTVMGAWFLATAFSQFLAAIIAQFTGVTGDLKKGPQSFPSLRDGWRLRRRVRQDRHRGPDLFADLLRIGAPAEPLDAR